MSNQENFQSNRSDFPPSYAPGSSPFEYECNPTPLVSATYLDASASVTCPIAIAFQDQSREEHETNIGGGKSFVAAETDLAAQFETVVAESAPGFESETSSGFPVAADNDAVFAQRLEQYMRDEEYARLVQADIQSAEKPARPAGASTNTHYGPPIDAPSFNAIPTVFATTDTDDVEPVEEPPSNPTTFVHIPPPGVEAGGVWGTVKFRGPNTMSSCVVFSVIGCILVAFPVGVLALACKCDRKEVYLKNGRLYRPDGSLFKRKVKRSDRFKECSKNI